MSDINWFVFKFLNCKFSNLNVSKTGLEMEAVFSFRDKNFFNGYGMIFPTCLRKKRIRIINFDTTFITFLTKFDRKWIFDLTFELNMILFSQTLGEMTSAGIRDEVHTGTEYDARC